MTFREFRVLDHLLDSTRRAIMSPSYLREPRWRKRYNPIRNVAASARSARWPARSIMRRVQPATRAADRDQRHGALTCSPSPSASSAMIRPVWPPAPRGRSPATMAVSCISIKKSASSAARAPKPVPIRRSMHDPVSDRYYKCDLCAERPGAALRLSLPGGRAAPRERRHTPRRRRTMTLYGWTGKILEVDLTSGAATTRESAPYLREYVGGRALAAKSPGTRFRARPHPMTPRTASSSPPARSPARWRPPPAARS